MKCVITARDKNGKFLDREIHKEDNFNGEIDIKELILSMKEINAKTVIFRFEREE